MKSDRATGRRQREDELKEVERTSVLESHSFGKGRRVPLEPSEGEVIQSPDSVGEEAAGSGDAAKHKTVSDAGGCDEMKERMWEGDGCGVDARSAQQVRLKRGTYPVCLATRTGSRLSDKPGSTCDDVSSHRGPRIFSAT